MREGLALAALIIGGLVVADLLIWWRDRGNR